MAIRTIVWGENIHEQTNEIVRSIYPDGMHNTIADALNRDTAIAASTAMQPSAISLMVFNMNILSFILCGDARIAVRAQPARHSYFHFLH